MRLTMGMGQTNDQGQKSQKRRFLSTAADALGPPDMFVEGTRRYGLTSG